MQYLQRVEAANATVQKFKGKSLKWGSVDCLQIAAHCLNRLGHNKPTSGVRPYKTASGALRSFREAGYENLIEAVNAYGLIPIAPAMAMAGDIIAYPAINFGGYGLGIALGDNKMLGLATIPATAQDPEHTLVDVGAIWAASHAWRAA
ncbi:hypothetical protein [uncultured Brevundimonas sp.]|uniref:DUF6950 family protein n=1 Tax=uncultured Brevundimonas sp. TaxID=213418 RepID=UPI0025CC949C|nr:hypothetical protein [uncultured Brevundimonas sp.]